MKKKMGLARLLCCAATAGMLTVASAEQVQVLCTTFPLYQVTRNITAGQENSEVRLLLPASLGCPHHYALTPRDMQKLAAADVLIINGLGLEEFLGAPISRANPDIRIIDSSATIEDLIHDNKLHGSPAAKQSHEHDRHTAECSAHCEHHAEVNPHLFASPRMMARITMNIAHALAAADPDGSVHYMANAQAYTERMNELVNEMRKLGSEISNNRIVQPHGIFNYLARDIGLEIVAETQPHGHEPSAADMLRILRIIRDRNAGAIVGEPQYPTKVGQTIARESGIPFVEIDPVASGPEDAPLNYYETVMQNNMAILRNTLGKRE